jgi:hypothetical protein
MLIFGGRGRNGGYLCDRDKDRNRDRDREGDDGVEMGNVADDKDAPGGRRGVERRRRDNKGDTDETNQDDTAVGGRSQPKNPDDPKGRDKDKDQNKDAGDKAAGHDKDAADMTKSMTAPNVPLKVLEPTRTDPVKVLQTRQRRIERLSATAMPEVHVVGQITSGKHLVTEPGEGACVR